MDWQFPTPGKWIFALVGVLAVLSAWLFRYELRQDKNGNMIRLNRLTGEVATIVGDRIVIAQKPREPTKLPATQPREWKPVTIEDLGNLQVLVTSMWRDDSIYYKVQASPFSEEIRRAFEYPLRQAKLSVLFEEENGFEISTADVELNDVTRIADGKGGFSGIERKGSAFLSFNDYSRIRSVDVAWSGFPTPSATDCVSVRNWDVKDRKERGLLVLSLTNSCPQTFTLEGTVRLWDQDNQPIGDRRIKLGKIAANESRDIGYTFDPSVGGIKFVGLR